MAKHVRIDAYGPRPIKRLHFITSDLFEFVIYYPRMEIVYFMVATV